MPERYWGCKPELVKGDNTWIKQAIQDPDLWAGQGFGFYIHGSFDCGKSGAASCLVLEMIRRCHAVEWMSVRDVPGIVFQESDDERERYKRLKLLDLLVLDDLGSQRFRLTSAAGTALEDVARIMFDRGRPVVYTSNVPWEEFEGRFFEVPAFVSVVQRTSIPVVLNEGWGNRPGMAHAV